MRTILLMLTRFSAFLSVWFAGCILFDRLLAWSGVWMMTGGVVTYMVADGVESLVAAKLARAKGASS